MTLRSAGVPARYPRRVEGRPAVAELYRPYGVTFSLDRCYDLAVHHDQATRDDLDPLAVFDAIGWPAAPRTG
jgi:hypothetical protein